MVNHIDTTQSIILDNHIGCRNVSWDNFTDRQ